MGDFVWLDSKGTYVNKTAITSISFEGYNSAAGEFWKIKMNDGDYFEISLDELNLIIGTAKEE